MTGSMGRRGFLGSVAATGLLAFVPHERLMAAVASAAAPGRPGRFLSAHELDTLRAVTDRLLPGPPEDPDPGAVQARCPEAIDALLGAFSFHPPLIHGGGPWSDRSGGKVDHMAGFVALDPVAELGWRIRLEGSRGMPERSFSGPVTGLQGQYRSGLAMVDAMAQPGQIDFASAPQPVQETILRADATAEFTGQVLSDTLDAMYGPPEYGGNAGLVGWRATRWPGDVQPRGYTPQQVTDRDPKARTFPYPPDQARTLLEKYLPGIEVV